MGDGYGQGLVVRVIVEGIFATTNPVLFLDGFAPFFSSKLGIFGIRDGVALSL